jgi:hypothetical protein
VRGVLRAILLASVIAVTTMGAGWWTVPVVAAIWTRVLPHAALRTSAAGAALGWAGLLAWTAWQAPVGPLTQRVSSVLMLPSWGLLALTLAFPALLAATAARAVRPASIR